MLPGFTACRPPGLFPLTFILLPIFNMNPINFYPVKYFVEISESDLTGTINLVNIEPKTLLALRSPKGEEWNPEPRKRSNP